jgi:hypothetical protein
MQTLSVMEGRFVSCFELGDSVLIQSLEKDYLWKHNLTLF